MLQCITWESILLETRRKHTGKRNEAKSHSKKKKKKPNKQTKYMGFFNSVYYNNGRVVQQPMTYI